MLRRVQAQDKLVAGFAARLKRAEGLEQIAVRGTVAQLGGMKAACGLWADYIRQASPSAALRALNLVVFRLNELAPANERPPDVSRLADEELDAEIERLIAARLEAEGWTRPGDSR
jgi:hypothetical protein